MTATAGTPLNPYAGYLQGNEPVQVLNATAGRLQLLSESIDPAKLGMSPRPGKWSPQEILCHLADCEIAFAFRLRQTLAEDSHVIQPFDQEKWAAQYRHLGAAQALSTFSALRLWNLALIESSLPDQAGKSVVHPERGTMNFATIVETMAGHDLNHLEQLRQIATAYAQ